MPDHSAHLPRGHEQRAAQPQDRGGGSVLQDPLRESSHYLHRYVRASRVTPALWSRKLTFVQFLGILLNKTMTFYYAMEANSMTVSMLE